MGLSEPRIPEIIENDKDDPLGKLVEFSNRFTNSTVNDTKISNVSDGTNPVTALFDAANQFMPYTGYVNTYQTPTWPTVNHSTTNTSTHSTTNDTWWCALAGAAATCDPTWLTNYPSMTTANSDTLSATAAAITAYSNPCIGNPFTGLPQSGFLSTTNSSIPTSSTSSLTKTKQLSSTNQTFKMKNIKNPSKPPTKTNCECPTCLETLRIGLANMPKNKIGTHNCHIPGCHKIYKKSSHLKAHLRWHVADKNRLPPKKNMMNVKKDT